MSESSKYVNVYTGLFAGALSGWFLRKMFVKSPAKTTVVGDPYGSSGWQRDRDERTLPRMSGKQQLRRRSHFLGALWGDPSFNIALPGQETREGYASRLRDYFLTQPLGLTEADIQNHLSTFGDSYWRR